MSWNLSLKGLFKKKESEIVQEKVLNDNIVIAILKKIDPTEFPRVHSSDIAGLPVHSLFSNIRKYTHALDKYLNYIKLDKKIPGVLLPKESIMTTASAFYIDEKSNYLDAVYETEQFIVSSIEYLELVDTLDEDSENDVESHNAYVSKYIVKNLTSIIEEISNWDLN